MLEKFKEAMKLIEESSSIYIVTHISPDGDAIGSSMAMYLTLKNMGKDVHVIIPSYSDRFSFLDELKQAETELPENEYDLLIAVDASSVDRLTLDEQDLNRAKKVLVIDHHQNTKINADVMVINSKSPAACELVYELFDTCDIEVTKEVARYIYMGIVTDTGSFNYRNTTSKTHYIAGKLLDTGIDFTYICKMVNDTMKENRLKLIAYVIDNMETYYDGRIRYAKVPNIVLKKLDIPDEDAEGLVNYLRCVVGVDVAIYARGLEDGTYKVSLRSNFDYDVSKIAATFGGGGHINAAGFTVNEEIDNVKDEIIKIVGVNL